MTDLERAAKEYEKCFKDPYYFFKTYCTVTTSTKTEMLERKTLEGKEFEEIANIFLKYFTEDNQREYYSKHIRLIEKVTHEDGDVAFVLSFNGNKYGVGKSALDLDQVLPLLRKEKLNKIKKWNQQ